MHAFGEPLRVETVPDPDPAPDGVVVEVGATGVCRSDWHGWMGHDPSIALPHVPGHELCGSVVDVTLPPAVERRLDKAVDEVAARTGFEVHSHRLDLIGRCAPCRD